MDSRLCGANTYGPRLAAMCTRVGLTPLTGRTADDSPAAPSYFGPAVATGGVPGAEGGADGAVPAATVGAAVPAAAANAAAGGVSRPDHFLISP